MRRTLQVKDIIRWTCPRCMSTSAPQVLYTYHKSEKLYDDQLLRDIFDSNDVWDSFNRTKALPTGLFMIPELTHAGGFKFFSERTLARARRLVEEISAGKRQQTIIKDLDRLSDMLCSVSDLTAFIRTAHPGPKFAHEANETFSTVVEYMNGLNQHERLYELTAQATARSSEERAVQKGLLHDFEQSGMSLPREARDQFVSLSSEAIDLEHRFNNNTAPAEPYLDLKVDDLQGLSQWDLRNISNGKRARVPTSGPIAQKILVLAERENTRRRLWEAMNTGRQEQVQTLERLLQIRAELASLTKHKTYAEAKLSDKMAKTPSMVIPSPD
jgi:mitochondrial intermediate peptidase